MKLIMTLILICVFILAAFSAGLSGKLHNNILLENTLPKTRQIDPAVLAIAKSYRKMLWLLATIFSLASLALFFTSYDSLFLILFWSFLLLFFSANYFCELHFIKKLTELLTQNNWQLETDPFLIDTELIKEKNRRLFPWQGFLLSFLILIFGTWYVLLYSILSGKELLIGANWLIFMFFIFSWYTIARLPVRPVTNNQTINRKFTDVTRHYWSKLFVISSWLISLLLFLPIITSRLSAAQAIIGMLIFISFILFLLFYSFITLFHLRKKQDQLLEKKERPRYYGDDPYWRYGVYINPNDSRLFVLDRKGLNLTINLGKTAGKILLGICGLLITAAIFFTVIPAYRLDFTADPLTASIQNKTVSFQAPFFSKKIATQQIRSVELIDQVPQSIKKETGFATDNYFIGNFSVKGDNAILLLDRNQRPIMVVHTNNETIYYTAKQPRQTLSSYQKLSSLIDKD